MRAKRCIWAGAIVWLLSVGAASTARANDLVQLSLEELLATEVTSVAKKRQTVSETAAAVFVISQEDIRRSAATNLPELLRMVPGIEVAKIDGNSYAITARGFNGRNSNKLLVLIDGRAVYLSQFSGVFWDMQLVPVEEIERVEVVRGPGATIWGANAVNGVINVITKHAVDSLAGRATVEANTDDSRRAYARYGWQIGDDASLRLYALGQNRTALRNSNDEEAHDPARMVQFGFRTDWEPNSQNAFTLQGDYQYGDIKSTVELGELTPPFLSLQTFDGGFEGANILGRWTHSWSDEEAFTLQAYWDHVEREEYDSANIIRNLFDIDASARFVPLARHDIVLGANIRVENDDIDSSPRVIADPGERTLIWFGGYVQDDITLSPERWRLSLGSKVEYNELTGFEYQPSVRLIWTGDNGLAAWAAVSRAVRTPARFERDLALSLFVQPPMTDLNPGPLPIQFNQVANRGKESETLIAYEAGFRGTLGSSVSVDLAAFYNDYDNILTTSLGQPIPVGTPIPTFFDVSTSLINAAKAEAFGLEASLDARLTPYWSVDIAGSWQHLDVDVDGANLDSALVEQLQRSSPRAQVNVRSGLDLTNDIEANVWVRYVGDLGDDVVESYTDLDAHILWRPTSDIELRLSGENLLEPRRQEFNQPTVPAGFIERRLRAGISVRF